ncbi:thiol reductant ABC exporter subunit CydD [Salipaludibacillus keqinensis]|uniref:Thiol reductant ABC exporter subunit CydD n=1 Tax=Salipaludibacillus keqinensis TaxID=2045207 RepID=A0A323T9N8_9BACI|nr:thiol reductant ABC exporter subunit CydD [Salipaludibacillus keqinensis]PYZ92201.1 thiol reductant ABC exporter subunit CydD [Salipaludibacillus keqinensis]
MKQLKQMAQSHKKKRSILMTSSFLIGASIIAQAYFIVAIVDHIFLNNGAFSDIYPWMGGLMVALLLRALLSYVNGRTGVKMASEVKGDIRRNLLEKFSRNPLQASLKGKSGEKVSIMLDSVDEVESYFRHYYPQMIQSTVVPLMLLVAVFSFNWVSGLILIVTAPFIPIMMIIIGKNTQKKSEEQMDKLTIFSGRFLDILQGLSTLKFFGRAKDKTEEIRQSSLDYRDATMDVLKIAFLSSLMLEFISMLSIALVALEVGLRLVIYDQLTFFTAFFVLILVPEFFASLKELGSAFHTGRGSSGAATRIAAELEEEEQPVKWGNEVLEHRTEPPSIELRDVHFSYGSDRFAIHQVNAHLLSNTHVAIVGRSGAGKTTLLNLLSGLIAPTDGDIHVNNRPLFDYEEKSWFDQLSYISQNPYLFSGTIEENIVLGMSDYVSRDEVVEAADKAGIAELIYGLDEGLDTRIGEGGRGLSGGEKQRVALARAFLKKPTVILFDEPTVGLDLKTEQILQKSMEELARSSTVITVAHRLHTIMNADQILFLEDGQLVANGTHQELLELSRDYREMVHVQQGGDAG